MLLVEPQSVAVLEKFWLFCRSRLDGLIQLNGTDEVDNFLIFTANADRSISDMLERWQQHLGSFPHLPTLAKDTLIMQGPSAPSESAFSVAGGYIRVDRSQLSDNSIKMMMKLKSWNRLDA